MVGSFVLRIGFCPQCGRVVFRVLVPDSSTLVCTAGNAQSSPHWPHTLRRTEPPPRPRQLPPSGPKQTEVRYPGVACSIPRCAPLESDHTGEPWSFRAAKPFRSSCSSYLDRNVCVGTYASVVPTQIPGIDGVCGGEELLNCQES